MPLTFEGETAIITWFNRWHWICMVIYLSSEQASATTGAAVAWMAAWCVRLFETFSSASSLSLSYGEPCLPNAEGPVANSCGLSIWRNAMIHRLTNVDAVESRKREAPCLTKTIRQ